MRDVRRIGGGRGLRGGPGKRVDVVFPGRPQSFRHQRRPEVDDCSPGRGGIWRRTAEQGAEHFIGEMYRRREKGFVAHIEDTRLPKCVMFGELVGGAGCVGGQEKEWM